ncbi:MAG TPA: hypothetical protein DEO60_13185 [Bacteroidales bacterium]|nr:hypothetical protein [Bacteroidales bacterium]HBZ22079.1 hypothetical protein [Bacteroidales bacterium]
MISSIRSDYRSRIIFIVLLIFVYSISPEVKGQEPPPRPIRINATAQGLSFGAFYHGASGGTVIISPAGARSSTGDVVLLSLGIPFSAALFQVHAHRGTVVSILNGPDTILSGTPSGTMMLHIGSSNPSSPFVSTVNFNVIIPLYIGGILTVGNSAANPPGSYTGTFDVTIVRE